MECLLSQHAGVMPERVALSTEARTFTWSTLAREVGGWERALRDMGVERGTRLALLAVNSPELVAVLLASTRIGACCMLFNARLTPSEIQRLAARTRPECLFADRTLASHLPGAHVLQDVPVCPTPIEPRAMDQNATAFVVFTSGTTADPKGVMLSVRPLVRAAEASGAVLGRGADQVWLGSLPLFHVGGLAMLWRCLLHGARLHLQDRFDEERWIHCVQHQDVTHASVVPTMLARVLQRPNVAAPSLRALLVGGGPSTRELLQAARARHLPALWTYGLTEACSQVATQRPDDADADPSAPPLPGTRIRIVDGDRQEVATGGEGDIEVWTPARMVGYLDDPDATETMLTPDGWLRTRDVGRLDARGRLHVLSRRTDLIVSGGENIHPSEVEAVLARHPNVADVAVVPVADGLWGQVPVACVVPRPGFSLEDLRTFARRELAGFKVPRTVVVLESLPRNAMGKLDRRSLRAMVEPPVRNGSPTAG